METYCVETTDGLLHLFTVLSKQDDEVVCEAIHTDGSFTIRIHQTINACLWDFFLKTGIFRHLDSLPLL